MVAEYIAKIKGDYSGLEKTIKQAQGMIKRINDDEVLIKFNYDGNEKELNKAFQGILKKHPELTIQLQYDLNKTLLEQKKQELKELETIKMTMDPSDIDDELTAIDKKIGKTKDSIDIITTEIERLSSLSPDLKITDGLNEAQNASSNLAGTLRDINRETSNVGSNNGMGSFADDISDANSELNNTKKKLEDINNLGEAVNFWNKDKTEKRERYTPYNTKSKEVSDATLVGAEEEISGKLVREAIEQSKIAVDGFIHSHPTKAAAFSDDDIAMYFKIADKIKEQVVVSLEEAMTLDMSKVNLDKSEDIVGKITNAYNRIDSSLKENMSDYISDVIASTQSVLGKLSANDPAANAVLKNLEKVYPVMMKELGEAMSFEEYQEELDRIVTMVLKNTPEAKGLKGKELESTMLALNGALDVMESAATDVMTERAQYAYQKVLKDVFNDPQFLKNGVTSAIKLGSVKDFIDMNSIAEASREVVRTAEQAMANAQDSHSESKVAEKLGEYWGEGYAKGILKHKDDVEAAVRELVRTGQLTMIELFTDQKNIMSDSLYEPLIEPIKRIILESKPELAAALSETAESAAETVSPTQEFDNEVQKNLTYLENYKNTIKEIDRLKLEPETEETKKKLEELNDLAKYFISNITVGRSENGHMISAEMMQFGGSWAPNLSNKYTDAQLKEFLKAASDNYGLPVNQTASEYSHIADELKHIEEQSESTRKSLAKDLIDSKKYAKALEQSFEDLVGSREELAKKYTSEKDKAAYQRDIDEISQKYPEILELSEKFKTWDSALKFTSSDEWKDFLATLPKAHDYLESIGYDFSRLNNNNIETASNDAENAIDAVTDKIRKEGDAAEEAAEQKEAFAKANEHVAEVSKPELYTEDSGQLSFIKDLTSAEKGLADSMEEVSAEARDSAEQIEGQLSLDFSKAAEGQKKYELAIINTNSELQRMADLAFQADARTSPNEMLSKLGVQAEAERKITEEAARRTAEIEEQNKQIEEQRRILTAVADAAFRMDTGQTGENQMMKMLQSSYKEAQDAVDKTVSETKAQMDEQASEIIRNNQLFEEAIQDYANELTKANSEAGELADRIQQVVNATRAAEAGSSTDLLSELREQVKASDAARESINKFIKDVSKFDDAEKYTQGFLDKVHELQQRLENASHQDIITPNQLEKLQEAKKELQGLAKLDVNKTFKELTRTKFLDQISSYLSKYTGLSKSTRMELEGIAAAMKKAGSMGELKDLYNQFLNVKIAARAAGEEAQSFFTNIKHRLSDMNAKFIAQFLSWQDILRYIRELSQNVIGIDTALTELRKVSDATNERLQQSFENSAKSAQKLGSTIKDVINITSDWARLGYDVDAAEELARVTTLFKTVGDNMTADDASSYLVSTLQGFQMTADQAEDIVDKYNQVANRFAIDTAGIGQALQRSAASFNAANTDLSKSIALVTATNEVVQNPESVGTLWKTMAARIRGKFVPIYREIYNPCCAK